MDSGLNCGSEFSSTGTNFDIFIYVSLFSSISTISNDIVYERILGMIPEYWSVQFSSAQFRLTQNHYGSPENPPE